MTSSRRTLHAADGGTFEALVVEPQGRPRAGVVVIQEIFGLNGVVEAVCRDLADHGYLAVALDLFWRLEPGVVLTDQTQAEWDRALNLMGRFDIDAGVRDIQATLSALRERLEGGRVGAVGHCLGGKLAFLTACRTDADAAVGYYAVGLDGLVDEARYLAMPLMLHIAEEDGFVPKPAQAAIIEALADRPAEVHTYPGRDHAFARPGGAHYHAGDAALANGRTLDFLARHLG